MTQLQKDILRLHVKGLTHAQISEELNCTSRYIREVIQAVAANEHKLTIANYFKAASYGLKTQAQLAAWFGVSDRTIRNFEKKNNIDQIGRAYSEFMKSDYLASLEKELIEISELLNLCNPDSPKLETIYKLLEILKYDKKDNAQTRK